MIKKKDISCKILTLKIKVINGCITHEIIYIDSFLIMEVLYWLFN